MSRPPWSGCSPRPRRAPRPPRQRPVEPAPAAPVPTTSSTTTRTTRTASAATTRNSDDLYDPDILEDGYGRRPYGAPARWHRPVAWVLALVMGVGMVALAFTAVYRGASSGRQDIVPTPASTGVGKTPGPEGGTSRARWTSPSPGPGGPAHPRLGGFRARPPPRKPPPRPLPPPTSPAPPPPPPVPPPPRPPPPALPSLPLSES